MSITFERETVEFQPITITRDSVPITSGIATSITQLGVRPTTWVDAVTLGTKVGCMVSGLSAGSYTIWVKIVDSPEVPVKNAGSITVV